MLAVDESCVRRADLLLRRLHRGDASVQAELRSLARQEGARELKRSVNDYRFAVWAHGRPRLRAGVSA